MTSADPGPRLGAEPDISVDRLRIRIARKEIVHAATFSASTGVTALVGPNGAGKSTLLRCLATLLPVSGGTARITGHDLSTERARRGARRTLGFLAQSPRFPSGFTVAAAIDYSAWLHGMRRRDRSAATESTLVELDLEAHAGDRLSTLSGGTYQRAMLGQVLVHRPKVLMLDEPTVGVDAEHRVELRRLIRRLATSRCVLMSTHLTEDVELLADRVVALADGRVTFDGSAGEIARLGVEAADDERAVERGLRRLAGR